jgi:hypothetical protein
MTKSDSARPMAHGLCLVVASLFACSRPEPSGSNVGRFRPKNAPNQIAVPTAQRATLHESDPPVSNPSSVVPAPEAMPSTPTEGGPRASVDATLARARRGGKSSIDYVVPDAAALAEYFGYVERLLKVSQTGSSTLEHVLDGFQLDVLDTNHLALVEQPERRRGAAAVVVRTGEAAAVAVEVPHSFFDESTLPIGLVLFETIRARVLLVNTVHRYRSLAGKEPSEAAAAEDTAPAASSDVAHAERSFFLSAHVAFVQTFPNGITIQLHGFRDDQATGIDAILSAANTSASVMPMAERLRQSLGLKIALYPKDVRKLGGTKNVQAQQSRRRQHPFVHIEMSKKLRQRLVEDRSLLDRFAACIAAELS